MTTLPVYVCGTFSLPISSYLYVTATVFGVSDVTLYAMPPTWRRVPTLGAVMIAPCDHPAVLPMRQKAKNKIRFKKFFITL
jgi:hypothetical protein